MIRRIDYLAPDKFRVRFDFDERLNEQIATIPGHRSDKENELNDGFLIVPAVSARHLLPFAVINRFEYPPELEEAAELFKDYDQLTILPVVSKVIDRNGDSLVIRTPERGNYNEREALKKAMGLGGQINRGRNGWGYNQKMKYWEIPANCLSIGIKREIKQLATDFGFMLMPQAAELLGG